MRNGREECGAGYGHMEGCGISIRLRDQYLRGK